MLKPLMPALPWAASLVFLELDSRLSWRTEMSSVTIVRVVMRTP